MADFLEEALKEGISKKEIANFLAQEQNFPIDQARKENISDEQIISFLSGGGAVDAFLNRFAQGFKSSVQGIGQLTGLEQTEDIKAQKEAADIYSALHPVAGFMGELSGNIADPISAPSWAVAPLKGATLAGTMALRGTAQGALGGFLEPITKEKGNTGFFSLDRILNTIIGGGAGAAIGGGSGALIQRLTRKPEVAPKTAADEISDVLTGASVKAADETAPVVKAEEAIIKTKEEQDLIDRLNKLKEDRLVLEEKLATGEPRPVTEELTPTQRMFAEGPERPSPLTGELSPTQRMFAEGPAVPRAVTGELTPMQRMFAEGPTTPRSITGGAQALTPMQRVALEGPQIEGMSAATKAAIDGPQLMPRPITGGASALTETQRMFLRGPQSPADIAKERLSKINEEIAAIENTLVRQTPLTPTEQATVTKLQTILDKEGFKTADEAIAATAKTAEERAAAQARIDAGQSPTPEQLVRNPSAFNLGFGKQTAGAAQTPKELVYAEDVPFKTQVEKVLSKWQPRKVTVGKVLDQESTDIVNRVTQALGETGKTLRGLGKGPMSAENFPTRAAAGEASILKEHADLIDFVLKNPKNEWTSDQIAAVAPQFYESLAFVKNTLKEYNLLREAGKMTDEIKTNIMAATQMHLGVINIFQGQRSKASAKMNALRHAKDMVMKGEKIGGYATPGAGCN